MADHPFANLSPEVLDCLACHILAANWLATQAADYSPLLFSSGDAIDEAIERALNKYRTMHPDELSEILGESLTRWMRALEQVKKPPPGRFPHIEIKRVYPPEESV